MPKPRVAVKIDMTGVEDTTAMLNRIGENVRQQEGTLREIGEDVASKVKKVPVDTGALAGSIKILKMSPYFFVVGSDLRYSRYVREGTSHNEAHPFKVPPFARQASAILSARIIR